MLWRAWGGMLSIDAKSPNSLPQLPKEVLCKSNVCPPVVTTRGCSSQMTAAPRVLIRYANNNALVCLTQQCTALTQPTVLPNEVWQCGSCTVREDVQVRAALHLFYCTPHGSKHANIARCAQWAILDLTVARLAGARKYVNGIYSPCNLPSQVLYNTKSSVR